MKRLGQHFLKNQAAIKKFLGAVDIQAEDTVIEIGPGHGELTAHLAEACKKIGADFIAIEKDEALAEKLEAAGLKIIKGDALVLLSTLIQSLPPATAFSIVGNIPYYITGHLFRIIGELDRKPKQCVFTIQKEVAERIAAAPPRMNRIAASVQFWADPKILAYIPKADFSPPPEVDSAIIKLRLNEFQPESPELYYAAVRALFSQPRKLALNNLMSFIPDKTKLTGLFSSLGIDLKARPQNLTIENIRAIAAACA